MINVVSLVDFRWRGPVLFANVTRGGALMLGLAWYRPGDFHVVADGLAPEEREWVLVEMRQAYYRGEP